MTVPFTDVLSQIRRGLVVTELTEALAELCEAVIDTGKAGELTLKIKIKPPKGDSCQVTLSPMVSSKTPKADMPDGIFFVGAGGDLLRNDPDQKEMFAPVMDGGKPYTPPVRGAG